MPVPNKKGLYAKLSIWVYLTINKGLIDSSNAYGTGTQGRGGWNTYPFCSNGDKRLESETSINQTVTQTIIVAIIVIVIIKRIALSGDFPMLLFLSFCHDIYIKYVYI